MKTKKRMTVGWVIGWLGLVGCVSFLGGATRAWATDLTMGCSPRWALCVVPLNNQGPPDQYTLVVDVLRVREGAQWVDFYPTDQQQGLLSLNPNRRRVGVFAVDESEHADPWIGSVNPPFIQNEGARQLRLDRGVTFHLTPQTAQTVTRCEPHMAWGPQEFTRTYRVRDLVFQRGSEVLYRMIQRTQVGEPTVRNVDGCPSQPATEQAPSQ